MNTSKTIKGIPNALWIRLQNQAEKEGRKLHQFIIRLLEWAIEEREKEKDNGK